MRTPISTLARRTLPGATLIFGLTAGAAGVQAQELRDQYHQAPRDTVSQEIYDGWKQFNLNCARCHGEDVQGTTIAPHLILSLKPEGPANTKEALPADRLCRPAGQRNAFVVRARHGTGDHQQDLRLREG